MKENLIFVGIKGSVVGIDRATGATKWSTELRGSDFVNVAVQNDDLFAASKGRLYRLNPVNGEVQWCNELPGLGYGLMSIAGASQAAPAAEKQRRDAAAAAAAVAASSS